MGSVSADWALAGCSPRRENRLRLRAGLADLGTPKYGSEARSCMNSGRWSASSPAAATRPGRNGRHRPGQMVTRRMHMPGLGSGSPGRLCGGTRQAAPAWPSGWELAVMRHDIGDRLEVISGGCCRPDSAPHTTCENIWPRQATSRSTTSTRSSPLPTPRYSPARDTGRDAGRGAHQDGLYNRQQGSPLADLGHPG